MGRAVALREDFDGPALRRLAKASKDAGQSRRLLALAEIYDGGRRTEAARIRRRRALIHGRQRQARDRGLGGGNHGGVVSRQRDRRLARQAVCGPHAVSSAGDPSKRGLAQSQSRISQVSSIFSAARRRFCYKNHEVVAYMERRIWHTRWVNRNRGAFGSFLTVD